MDLVLKRMFCRHCVTAETPQCAKICKLKDLQNDVISEYDPWITCTDEIGPSLATILITHWPFQTPITFSWEKCSFALDVKKLYTFPILGSLLNLWQKILALFLLILSHQKSVRMSSFSNCFVVTDTNFIGLKLSVSVILHPFSPSLLADFCGHCLLEGG